MERLERKGRSRTKRLRLLGGDGYEAPPEEHAGRSPRRALRHARRRGRGAGRRRPVARRAARRRPAVPARRGRVRRPPRDGDDARGRARRAAPGPTCSTGRPRSPRLPTSPPCWPASSGGTTPRRPASSAPTASWSPPRRPTPRPRPAAVRVRHDRTATPPIELDRRRGAIELRHGARWPVPDGPSIDELRGVTEVIDDEREVAERSRDWWPLAMHWSLAGEVPGARRRRRPAVVGRRGRRGRADLRRPRRPAHRRRRAQRRVRGVRARLRRCRARPHRAGRHRRRRRHVGRRRGARRDVRPRPRGRAAGRPRAVRAPLPAELRHRHGRRLGGLPRRRAVLHALRQDRGPGRRPRGRARRRHGRAHRRRAGRCRRPRPHPALPRLGGHARRHHEGVAARPTRCRPPSGGRRGRSPRSPTASRPAGRCCAAGRRPPCCGCTTPSSRPVATAATACAARCSCSTRASRRSSTPRWRSSPTPAPPPSRRADELVDAWLEHRNDTSALQALTRKGFVVDTMEIAAPWSRLGRPVRRRARRPDGRPPRACRQLPPLAQLPRRRVPVLHVRRHAAGRRDRVDVRRPVGRRPAGRARQRRQPLAPPRRRPQPRPLHRRGARRRPPRARRGEGGARPGGHPQPRQARPAVPVRPFPGRLPAASTP